MILAPSRWLKKSAVARRMFFSMMFSP